MNCLVSPTRNARLQLWTGFFSLRAPRAYFAVLALWISIHLLAPGSKAQLPGADANSFNPALLHLFSQFKAFGCKADLRITDAKGNDVMSMPMGLHYLENKVRLEANLSELKSTSVGSLETAMFKQVGMDQVVTILRPDKKASTIIFPMAKAYADNPLTPEEAAQMKAVYDLKVTPSGNETVQGQPCAKQSFTVTSGGATKLQGTLWRTTSPTIKNFPVKILIPQDDGNLEMILSQVKFQRPDASLFEPPNGFTKHPNVEAMLQSRLGTILGGQR